MQHDTTPIEQDLRTRWDQLRSEGIRIRAAAAQLGCSEAELLEVTDGYQVVPLRPDFAELFEAFEDVGEVMASTRNDWAVIEKHGEYAEIDIGAQVGLVLNHDIDLRLFMWNFARAYAVTNPDHRRGPLHSIQFFDACGDSLHKVYMKGDDAEAKLAALIERFEDPSAARFVAEERTERQEPELPGNEVLDAFREAWRALEDTHDFFDMLREHGVSRRQAMHHGPAELVDRLVVDDVVALLHRAADDGVPIMCFVGNRGCIEIHTGEIHRVAGKGDWINVLDPTFNLHLNLSGIDEVWLVRKPTVDGIVTSVECLGAEGEVIAQFFGERKPGIEELGSWRSLAERLAA